MNNINKLNKALPTNSIIMTSEKNLSNHLFVLFIFKFILFLISLTPGLNIEVLVRNNHNE